MEANGLESQGLLAMTLCLDWLDELGRKHNRPSRQSEADAALRHLLKPPPSNLPPGTAERAFLDAIGLDHACENEQLERRAGCKTRGN